MSDQLNIDIAPDGTIYGIELLNANEQLRAADRGALIIVNEAVGSHQEVPLAGEPTWGARSSDFCHETDLRSA